MKYPISTQKTCPYCGAPVKYLAKVDPRTNYERPTTFTCGTVTSPNWIPPIKGKECAK